jgi:hypothetical protein
VRVLRTALRARWLPRHLLAIAVIVAFVFLGRWQWNVSQEQRGGLQNLLYAFEWWAFAVIVVYGWWRLLRDDASGRRPSTAVQPPNPRLSTAADDDDDSWAWTGAGIGHAAAVSGVLGTESGADGDETDGELADYNRYLAWLNARSERAR